MTESAAPPAQDMGVVARAIGIITSPTPTYEVVVRSPKPAIMLLLVALVMGIGASIPQFTEKGRLAVLNTQVEAFEKMTGQQMTDQMYQMMEQRSHYNGITTLISTFIFTPIMALFFAALYWGVFNAALGGTATFKQVLGVVTHSMVIMAVSAVAAAPIMMMQDQINFAGPFNLGALVPFMAEDSFVRRFLGGVNVFTLWQIGVIAIGLGVLYRRKSTPIMITLFVLYALLVAVGISIFSAFTRGGR